MATYDPARPPRPTDAGYTTNTAPAPAAPPPAGPVSLEESMRKRMAAVQGGQADPGNADFYGYNQLTQSPGAAAPPPPPPGAAPGGAPAPITTAQGVTGTQATVGATAAQGAPTTVAQSFQQSLINRLNPQQASADSASINPAIQANRLSEQRGFDRNRNLLAERAAATGTNNSGGFESQLLGLAQDRAGRESAFAGDAVRQEQDRLDRNQNSAMGLSGSMLTGQQGLSQQMDLANLDATLRRAGMDLQGDLGRRDLDLRGELGRAGLNNQLLGLLMNNDQFGRSLSQNATQFGASLDQNGIMSLLGLL
jgi:hypothetical protein